MRLTRRRFLQGLGAAGAVVRVGLPPLEAAETTPKMRFVLWFNGNGIPESIGSPPRPGPITK